MSKTALALIWIAVSATTAIGQVSGQRACSPAEVASEVSLAAAKANIALTESAMSGFRQLASAQSDAYAAVCGAVPKDVRVQRLAQYLVAKSKYKDANVRPGDFRDFHWAYLSKDVEYVPFRFGGQSADLLSIESGSSKFHFQNRGAHKMEPGTVMLIPTPVGERAAGLTAIFDIGRTKATWSGNAGSEQVFVKAAATTKGCEIYINSRPRGAAVYFNRMRWYASTDTSAVQDPGTWEVTIELQGYKSWRERRTLGPGESWTINAKLAK